MKIIELFAGVGGFKLGTEYKGSKNKVIWSNQWEPSTKIQHASDIYKLRFNEKDSIHSNEDISKVDEKTIPQHDMLCGGFPCQDYSVARPKSLSKGLEGKKGVLWWDIHRIIKEHNTKYLMLENVDRLILSPSKQKGRDFAIILKTLSMLDYIVEWRVINAAEYGFPQKRRRTYIFAYKKDSKIYNNFIKKNEGYFQDFKYDEEKNIFIHNFVKITKEETKKYNTKINDLIFTKAFPIKQIEENTGIRQIDLNKIDIYTISENFNKEDKEMFFNTGIMINGIVTTLKTKPLFNGKQQNLGDILINEEEYVKDLKELIVEDEKQLEQWKSKRIAKAIPKTSKSGHCYLYKQGTMSFPDPLNKPSRTIITSEGGKSASRTTHIIYSEHLKKYRRLHPIELERLNGFPDNHTKEVGFAKRGFLMGNALVVGIVEQLAKTIDENI
jgi:DNA (cytosine-5)-methyltransferase 1